jgi:uncharacterized protein (TIGR02611 family)
VSDPHTARRTGARALQTLLRRGLVAVTGVLLLLVGVAMLVLPGPGMLVIFAGLAVLSREFPWAERLAERLRARARAAAARLRRVPSTGPGRP